MIHPHVYGLVGIKAGEVFPSYTSIGSYTILYQTEKGEHLCGTCVNSYVNPDDPVTHAGTYDEGDSLECVECQKEIESSYGPITQPCDKEPDTLRCPVWADQPVMGEEISEKC